MGGGVEGEGGGLGELGFESGAVAEGFSGGAGGDFGHECHEVGGEELVLAGLGDVEAVGENCAVPGGVEGLGLGGFAGFVVEGLLAGAEEGGDDLFLKVDAAEEVVVGVGEVDYLAVGGEGGALGVVEGGGVGGAVGGALFAGADGLQELEFVVFVGEGGD